MSRIWDLLGYFPRKCTGLSSELFNPRTRRVTNFGVALLDFSTNEHIFQTSQILFLSTNFHILKTMIQVGGSFYFYCIREVNHSL